MKNNPLPGNCFAKFLRPKISLHPYKLKTCILILVALCLSSLEGYPQSSSISINKNNVLLEEVLTDIENQTDYLFIYSNQIDVKQTVSVNEENTPVSEILPTILNQLGLTYSVEGSHIILKKKPQEEQQPAQPQDSRTIEGVVVDEEGGTLVGANVIIEGTTTGVTTDLDGKFSITVPSDDAVLLFSSLGYLTERVNVGAQSSIDIALIPDLYSLSEVVVVGYGVQTRASVTGSVASVKGEDIAKNRTPDVINSMTGQLPGVVINSRTGEPGREDPEILIRGRSTTGSTAPLIIIDGVERSDLSRINPNDIDNISVLKDASAAIYGARAANGVILITTKRGSKGDPVFNFSYNQGFSQPTRNPIMADSHTFFQVYNEIEVSAGRDPRYSEEEIEKFRIGEEPGYTSTDWYETMTKTLTPQSQINLSVSGGSDALDYYISLGKMGQDGHFNWGTTRVDRYNFRSNLSVNATQYIQVGMDLSGRIDQNQYPGNPDTRGTYSHIYLSQPNWTPHWPGTDYLRPNRDGQNLINWVSDNAGSQNDLYRALETKLHYNIDIPWVEGLSVRGSANYDAGYNHSKYFNTPNYVYDYDATTYTYSRRIAGLSPSLSQLWESFDQKTVLTLNTQINYSAVINQHRIGAMVGYEQMQYDQNYLSAYRGDFLSPALPQMFAGTSDKLKHDNDGAATRTSRQNYFGRATYDYDGRYLSEIIFRYDGSPNFPEDQRWGFFPAVSLGWRISEEAFMSNVVAINNLKIRGSYGEMGNDDVPPYQHLAAYEFYKDSEGDDHIYIIGEGDVVGLVQSVAPNPNITWEVAKTTNIGIELSMWSGLFGMELDLFKTERSNILTQRRVIIPDYTGLELPDENIGIVENKGFELMLSHRNSMGSNFSYSVMGNVSFARNKVVFSDEAPAAEDYQLATGKPIGSQLFYDAIGVFSDDDQIDSMPTIRGARTRPGDIMYRDVNGDGEIDSRDRIRINQTPTPEIVYSMTTYVRYKGIDLSIQLQGQENAKTYVRQQTDDPDGSDNPYWAVMSYSLGNFLQWRADDRWTPDNTDATQPRGSIDSFNNNTLRSTHWLMNAGFLRLKNVEIGYTVPESISQRIGVSGLRAYVSGHNLYIIYDHMKELGFDPETTDFWYYPQQRIFNFGVNLTF